MKTRRIYIDWQKVINKDYPIWNYDILHVYAWLLKISKDCSNQCGWNRSGFHQTFHGYSHNNNPGEVYELGCNFEERLYQGFVNILCKTNRGVVLDFLKKENIILGKKRVITITENDDCNDYYNKITGNRFGINPELLHITKDYVGLELKKEFCHPEYEGRIHPRLISNPTFYVSYKGLISIKLYFNFENYEYDASSWNINITQKESEPLVTFFNRAIQEIDNMLVESNNCDNCPLWVKNDNGDHLRHGYRGGCRQYKTCKKSDLVTYKWWSEKEGICDNAIHDYLVYPYYRNGNSKSLKA